MATRRWQGGARAVAQVNTFAFAGTWEATDLIRATVGSKTYDFTAGSTVTNTVVANLVAAWNLLSATDYPEFAELTASGSASPFTLTSDTPGKPFTVTLTPLESNGGAADDQTIAGDVVATTGTVATASAGPYDWSTAANWSGGAVPIDADLVVIQNNASYPILYGLAQSAVTLASLTIDMSFSALATLGQGIGLPEINNDSSTPYFEYRATYLNIKSTLVTIGLGLGLGTGRIKLNLDSAQTTATIYNAGTPVESGLPSLLLKGTHASNVVNIFGGSVGIAHYGGETAVVATLRVEGNSTVVRCGSGTTLTTINQGGGELELNSAATTINKTGGTLNYQGSGAVTTINDDGGTTNYMSSGTVTTLNVGGAATVDFSKDIRTRTVSACDVFAGATINDPFKTVTWTAGIDLNRCGLADVTINVGEHVRLTPAAVA